MAKKLWFTSDSHFGHKNVLIHEKRPFASIEEHDEAIIENWNKFVSKQDEVKHVGDFCFRSDKPADWYLKRLNGQIHIIWGNHDDHGKNNAWKIRDQFASHNEMAYIKHEGQKIHLCHYRMMVWRSSNRESWHLCGHSHGNLNKYSGQWFDCRWLDVGIMNKGWKPDVPWLYEFEEIKAYMANRVSINHHPEEGEDDE